MQVKKGETKKQYVERIMKEGQKLKKKQIDDLKSGKIKVVFDVDDFGFLLPGYDDLLRFKKTFPNFKVSCFTIPLPKEFLLPANKEQFSEEKYKKWARIINEQDWIEIAIHGFSHTMHESDVDYDRAKTMIKATENLMKRVGLKYEKIFKAPFWQYSYDMLWHLKEKDYIVALDRNFQRPVPDGTKTYIYNWSYEEPALPASNLIKGHGHFFGRNKNNISSCLQNISRLLPRETRFIFISEAYANEEKNNGKETSPQKGRGKEN